jgi:L-2,4-diaminobutyric acid acetyltransferase
MVKTVDSTLTYRKPTAEDGQQVWQLVKDTGVLDLNSSYAYIMFCDYFAETCTVAVEEGKIVGFVSAFMKPADPSVLFVWQVAVDASQRGKGVATSLIKDVLKRKECKEIQMIELTISPSNEASQSLFKKVARELHCEINASEGYPATWFPGGAHEDEDVYRIGPIRQL